MSEEWRDVPEAVGLYQVSSLGRVRSLPRKTQRGHSLKARVLLPCSSLGYPAVANRVDELGAGFDDSLLLAVAADHESVDVLQENQRQPFLIATHDKSSRLLGAVHVDHAAIFDRPWRR